MVHTKLLGPNLKANIAHFQRGCNENLMVGSPNHTLRDRMGLNIGKLLLRLSLSSHCFQDLEA